MNSPAQPAPPGCHWEVRRKAHRHAELTAAVSAALDGVMPRAVRALVAVSGGPDSTALVYLVAEARPDLELAVGHVRHGLRDDAEDAAVAAGHAAALGLAYVERCVTVDRWTGEGIEAAARAVRYDALACMARAVRASWVLVGHTADDQAETVLLNLARGSGIRGLAGMPPVRALGDVTIVRPLLGLERAQVRAVVTERGLRVAQDPTNRDVERRRARARHETLPRLAALTGHPEGIGGLVRTLVRLTTLARDDADALDAFAENEAGRLVQQWGPARAVPRGELSRLPRALAGRIVRLMLASGRDGLEGLDAESVWAVLDLPPGKALHVAGGAWVTVGGGWLAVAPSGLADLPERPLAVPGATAIPEIGAVLLAGPAAEAAEADLRPPGATCAARATVPGDHALVGRARRPGDRMWVAGGRRKVSDVLSDAGVPRALRGLVPVVATADDVLWIPGVAVARGTGDVPLALVRKG